ncbi:MAG: hypothetical protein IT464_07545 [Planctomycetes bacterium]|nr:hypothetical protein [Planctomycetota bacterium]
MKWLISICGLLAFLTACSSRQEQPVSETACGGACRGANVEPAVDNNEQPADPAPASVEPAEVWIVVDGMTKVQGIT